jgi:hypothetical protein
MAATIDGSGADQLITLVWSWAPFAVLMAIWFFLIRRPLMRRLTDWFQSRKQ